MNLNEETHWLEQAKAGDADAFERVMAPHLPMLFAYSRAVCGDYHAAQDVVQETVLIAFRKLDRYFPEADFSAWLRAIARREALAARRKLAKAELLSDEAIERFYQVSRSEGGSQQQEALAECVQRLTGQAREVIEAHYFEGKPLTELAGAWQSSASAVKQLVYRARLALRDCVQQRLAANGGEP